eukprot:1081103-Rhodomonas_salina.3
MRCPVWDRLLRAYLARLCCYQEGDEVYIEAIRNREYLRSIPLCACYARSGTRCPLRPSRLPRSVSTTLSRTLSPTISPIMWCVTCPTDIPLAAIHLIACYAIPGTDILHRPKSNGRNRTPGCKQRSARTGGSQYSFLRSESNAFTLVPGTKCTETEMSCT